MPEAKKTINEKMEATMKACPHLPKFYVSKKDKSLFFSDVKRASKNFEEAGFEVVKNPSYSEDLDPYVAKKE